MLHFHIITLFPEAFASYLDASILGRAQLKSGKPRPREKAKLKVSYYNPRDFTKDKWKRVDRRPYGGGPGMVLEAESLLRAAKKAIGRKKNVEVLFFSTDGVTLDEPLVQKLSKRKDIVMICGHYEGVDARVQKILKAKKVSVGPYVLTGGELPAMLVVDAVSRFVPGVLGKPESLEASRIASAEVYTRPEVLKWNGKKYRVPKVLLSGNHKKIEEWKRERK